MSDHLPPVSSIDMLIADLKQHITLQVLLDSTVTLIEDIKSGVIPDEAPVSLNMSIGDLKAVPQWDKNADAVTKVVSMVAGRAMHLCSKALTGHPNIPAMLFLLSITHPETYKEPFDRLIASTDEAEAQTVRQIVGLN